MSSPASPPRSDVPPEVVIRPARTADAAAIAAMNLAMAEETEGLKLDAERLLSGVRAALADPHKGRYFVAEGAGGALQACLLLTLEWSDWRNGWFWWIQSVYTQPEARGRGLYRALYRQVLESARSTPDVRGLRLYVEQDNTAAQAVYEHLGMQRTHYRMYETSW